MYDPAVVLTLVGVFLVAGTIKGVIGLGLPTVSLALLAVIIDLPSAMALMLVPSFATNLWQALIGANGGAVLRRLWPFLTTATVTVWVGAAALTRVETGWLSALLGVLLVSYALMNLAGFRVRISTCRELWAGPLIGSLNGILTGMTGSFVVPGVLYLQAIDLPRDALIQAMGMLFTVSTLALALALHRSALLTLEQGLLSLAALVPAVIGMLIGQRLRKNLSEPMFRRIFFISLLMLGIYIIASA